MRELFLDNEEIRIILNLLPKGDVPNGLDPTFYHTLTYEGDMALQVKFDALREKLRKITTFITCPPRKNRELGA